MYALTTPRRRRAVAAAAYANRPYGLRKTALIGAGLAAGAAYLARGYRSSGRTSAPKKSITFKVPVKVRKVQGKQSLAKQVKSIQRELKTNMGTLIYKSAGAGRVVTTANVQTTAAISSVDMSVYETVLAELRFFNPSVPGTLTQGSGASGTYDRNYHFKNVYSKVSCVNNYQVPVKVKLYCCMPKEDTNITPQLAYTNGLTDVGAPTATSPHMDLTDSPQFNKLWRIVSVNKKVLQPGQVLTASQNCKDVMYNPAIFDSHALSYQKKYKTFYWIVRITGVLSHDTAVTTEQGYGLAGIDINQVTKFVVEYDAGIDLTYIVVADTGAAAFTNGAVVSSKPVSDNIGYSIA